MFIFLIEQDHFVRIMIMIMITFIIFIVSFSFFSILYFYDVDQFSFQINIIQSTYSYFNSIRLIFLVNHLLKVKHSIFSYRFLINLGIINQADTLSFFRIVCFQTIQQVPISGRIINKTLL